MSAQHERKKSETTEEKVDLLENAPIALPMANAAKAAELVSVTRTIIDFIGR